MIFYLGNQKAPSRSRHDSCRLKFTLHHCDDDDGDDSDDFDDGGGEDEERESHITALGITASVKDDSVQSEE